VWAVEGFGELGDGCFGFWLIEELGELVPLIGAWVCIEECSVEEVFFTDVDVDEDGPGFLVFGDGGEPLVEAGGGVPGF